ncbi:hypothetical protein MKW94_020873 [Papaver nudicaule]|uniref:Uncharacterized protein n=1 Tax=Papaver nudicaule TaxID=74823 RepID=A0AA41VP49_PAPNU|nr:hypothetical protein [Papaver nudicaule]
MQRQSLGGSSSPSSKLHLCEENDEEERRKSQRLVVTDSDIDDDEDEIQVVKKKTIDKNHHHRSSSFTQNEKSIHLIPILTICCILILYLVSYDPSQKDLVNIDGFRKTTSKQIDSEEIDISDFRRGDVLEIRSHRSLHEIHKDATNKKSRSHRKIGDF